MAKIRTIKLTRVLDTDASTKDKLMHKYRIMQVTDSVFYHVNEFIDEETADKLCESESWKVIIS